MYETTNAEFSKLRGKAFEEFEKVAKAEEANGAENLALFRLVPKFSTAPTQEADDKMICMRYWSRHGQSDYLIEAGYELLNWARENGYPKP